MINIISSELNRLISIIDENLNKYMSIDGKYQEKIFESMKYSLFSGGKRLRPIFAIKTYEMFNENIKDILPYASAIEMIHTYSLIHDDLPSMDDDDYRRGKPTNHMVYGDAMAILTGDSLLNFSFEIMLEDILNNSRSEIDRVNKVTATKLISNSSGVQGMIGGQVVDIFGSQGNMNKDKLLFMYEAKTAALFKGAILSGAIIGGGDKKDISILEEYSSLLGLSYQIQDDLIDIKEDKKINKLTYLSFYDREKAEIDLERLSLKCFKLLDSLENRDTSFLKELTKMLINRKI